jgi:hypothetical protein
MNYVLVLLISAAVSFFVHDFLDRNYIGLNKRNIRLVLRGYHIHHSFVGALVIACAFLFSGGGYVAFACYGYGMGNIWQHKVTHNRVKQKGMVFITRLQKYKRSAG